MRSRKSYKWHVTEHLTRLRSVLIPWVPLSDEEVLAYLDARSHFKEWSEHPNPSVCARQAVRSVLLEVRAKVYPSGVPEDFIAEKSETSVFSMIARLVRLNVRRYHPHLSADADVEDLTTECYLSFYRRGLVPKHNPEISSFPYYVQRSVVNFLIDKERTHSRMVSESVLTKSDSDEEVSFFDFVDNGECEDLISRVEIESLLSLLGDKAPSNSPTYRSIISLLLEGYRSPDIAVMFGVPSQKIRRMRMEAVRFLRSRLASEGVQSLKATA